MYPHRIRLRGPWEYESISTETPASGRIHLPWPAERTRFAGAVRYRRRFGLPRQIDPHERVWLIIRGLVGAASVSLNGHRLEAGAEFDVTADLRERNELQVEIERDDQTAVLWEEIALEIRCTAFLRNVQISFRVESGAPLLEATGEVIGDSREPLELYLILDRSNVAYAPVTADEFRLQARDLEIDCKQSHRARVELVAGGVVYYEFEQNVG
jgi:hypothetical protein